MMTCDHFSQIESLCLSTSFFSYALAQGSWTQKKNETIHFDYVLRKTLSMNKITFEWNAKIPTNIIFPE